MGTTSSASPKITQLSKTGNIEYKGSQFSFSVTPDQVSVAYYKEAVGCQSTLVVSGTSSQFSVHGESSYDRFDAELSLLREVYAYVISVEV